MRRSLCAPEQDRDRLPLAGAFRSRRRGTRRDCKRAAGGCRGACGELGARRHAGRGCTGGRAHRVDPRRAEQVWHRRDRDAGGSRVARPRRRLGPARSGDRVGARARVAQVVPQRLPAQRARNRSLPPVRIRRGGTSRTSRFDARVESSGTRSRWDCCFEWRRSDICRRALSPAGAAGGPPRRGDRRCLLRPAGARRRRRRGAAGRSAGTRRRGGGAARRARGRLVARPGGAACAPTPASSRASPGSYADEVEGATACRPTHTDEAVFAAAHERLEELLPGVGPLAERYEHWQASSRVPTHQVERTIAAVIEEARAWSRRLVELPAGEGVALEIVRGEPWLAFCDYLGDLRSRIAVNVDLPMSAIELLVLALETGLRVQRLVVSHSPWVTLRPRRRRGESDPGILGEGDFTRRRRAAGDVARRSSRRRRITDGPRGPGSRLGGGNAALPAARLGANVLGVDLARNLVEAGNGRAESLAPAPSRFQDSDADDLSELEDDSSRPSHRASLGAMFAPRSFDVAKENVRVTTARRPDRHGEPEPRSQPMARAPILMSARPSRHLLRKRFVTP